MIKIKQILKNSKLKLNLLQSLLKKPCSSFKNQKSSDRGKLLMMLVMMLRYQPLWPRKGISCRPFASNTYNQTVHMLKMDMIFINHFKIPEIRKNCLFMIDYNRNLEMIQMEQIINCLTSAARLQLSKYTPIPDSKISRMQHLSTGIVKVRKNIMFSLMNTLTT